MNREVKRRRTESEYACVATGYSPLRYAPGILLDPFSLSITAPFLRPSLLIFSLYPCSILLFHQLLSLRRSTPSSNPLQIPPLTPPSLFIPWLSFFLLSTSLVPDYISPQVVLYVFVYLFIYPTASLTLSLLAFVLVRVLRSLDDWKF